jgi:hypothetical protein
VDLQLTVVANEAQLSEPVHEKAHPRAGSAHHLRQSLLTDFGDCDFGLSVFAEVSEQKKNASQSFLTGIEKLVNQVLFVSDVPCHQISDEHVRKCVFPADPSTIAFLSIRTLSNRSLRLRNTSGESAL